MWKTIADKPVLSFSIFLATCLWCIETLFHYLVFNSGQPMEVIPSDHNELWMRLLVCGMIIAFGSYLQREILRRRSIHEEKLRTLRATMHTVEDRVGNALMSIKYLLLDAENDRAPNKQTSKQIISIIDSSIEELREIHEIKRVNEKRFAEDIFYLETNPNDDS